MALVVTKIDPLFVPQVVGVTVSVTVGCTAIATLFVFKLIAPAVVKALPPSDAPVEKFNAPEAIIDPLNDEPAPKVTAPLT